MNLLLPIIFLLRSAGTQGLANEYSSKPVLQAQETIATNHTSFATRSDIECAAKCKSFGTGCNSHAFVAATGICVTAPEWNANFSTAAPGCEVFRQPKPFNTSWFNDVYAQVGGRQFRVILQRFAGYLSFARTLEEYENGFCDDTDFWLGLKTINILTYSTPKLIRIEGVTWAGVVYVMESANFRVLDASVNYSMTVDACVTGSFNTTYDSLISHSGGKFDTLGRDNSNINCAALRGGGWWHRTDGCGNLNPTGLYYASAISNELKSMFWYYADGDRSMKSIRVMLLV